MSNDRKLKHSRLATICQNFINGFKDELSFNNDEDFINFIVDNGFMTRQEYFEIEYYDSFSYNKESE